MQKLNKDSDCMYNGMADISEKTDMSCVRLYKWYITTAGIIAAVVFFYILLFAGCASAPSSGSQTGVFEYFSESRDIYIYMPVKENIPFINLVVSSVLPNVNTEKIISRISTVYFAADLPADGQSFDFQFAALGNFPKSISGFAFKKKDGWEKMRTAEGVYYQSKYGIEIAVPKSGLVLGTIKGMENFLQTFLYPQPLQWPAGAVSLMTAVPGISPAENILQENPGDLKFYLHRSESFVSRILGPDVRLPVTYALGTLSPVPEGYMLNTNIHVAEARVLRLIASLFRIALNSYGASHPAFAVPEVHVKENNSLSIDGLYISYAALAGFFAL